MNKLNENINHVERLIEAGKREGRNLDKDIERLNTLKSERRELAKERIKELEKKIPAAERRPDLYNLYHIRKEMKELKSII